ncbi:MAG: EscU/YscU/HrcU family type III secretion system export apparatus switch protein [Alphaproteobacteria bacterium]
MSPFDRPATPPLRRAVARPVAVAVEGGRDGDMGAPARVVAKGRGAVAEQILALAFAAGVRVREDADLVEILEAIEIDADIPAHALAAIGEILTYVYRANGRLPAPAAPARTVEAPR